MGYGYDDESSFPEEIHVKQRGSIVRGTGLVERHPLADPALIQEFLEQPLAWCSVGLQYFAVKDMTPAHALATVNFILKRAPYVALVLLAADAPDVGPELVVDEREARRFVLATPLLQALLVRGGESSALPWAGVEGKA